MSNDFLNRDGQPPSGINANKVRARQQAELSGILKGVACDNIITPNEAKFVFEWINVHRQVEDGVTFTDLIEELQSLEMKTRGAFDDPEMLQSVLKSIHKLVNGGSHMPSPTDLTIDIADEIEASEIIFQDRNFCFTGKLKLGPRNKAHEMTKLRNGIVADSVTNKLDYLVCGDLGSRDWSQSSFGEKIRHALCVRKSGGRLLIISEATWAEAINLK
jgi:BRCA1 C Terminus (BRCT) domain